MIIRHAHRRDGIGARGATKRILLPALAALAALAATPFASPPEESPFVTGPLEPGEREKLVYVWTGDVDGEESDFIAIIDADPASPTYGEVIGTAPAGSANNETHHFGYTPDARRIIAAGMFSDRLFIYDVADARRPKLLRTVDLAASSGHTGPHSVFAVPGGVLVSVLGGKASGSGALVKLDTAGNVLKVFEPTGTTFMYDIGVKPELDRMITSAWAHTHHIKAGDSAPESQGETVAVWDFRTMRVLQVEKLDKLPLSVRWLNAPDARDGYINCMGGSSVWYWKDEGGRLAFRRVIELAEGAAPADVRISPDDRYLYVSLFGGNEVQQYDIADRTRPRLVSRVSIPQPNMLKLSADGRRLYATNSAFSLADGDAPYGLYLIDVDESGMRLDDRFRVDFETAFPSGRARPHDMLFH